MQTELQNQKKLIHLKPKRKNISIVGNVLKKGRYLIGRSESCDIIISHPDVSAIHAVLEVHDNNTRIYDMNSKTGIYINEVKVVAESISIGSLITLGTVELELTQYVKSSELPPVLDVLDPLQGRANPLNKEKLPVNVPDIQEVEEDDSEPEVPYIVYPLSADPKSDYSEYIFEDKAELYPIFKYEHNRQAVEVIILYNDKVYSVDYLPEKDGTFSMAGSTKRSDEVEFPYFGKEEKLPFVEIQSGNCVVHQLNQYELTHLSDKGVSGSSGGRANLQDDDIVKLKNKHLEIYIRKVSSPPRVKSAPFFRRDKSFWKYVFFFLVLGLLPTFALQFISVDKEIDEEKQTERIATILYKQPLRIKKTKAVEKTKTKVAKNQSAPKKPVVKKQKKKPTKTKVAQQKSNSRKKKTTTNPGTKSAAKKQVVKKVRKPIAKRKSSQIAKTRSASRAKTSRTRTNTVSKSIGKVDVYKSRDFKSSISSFMAKGGSLKGARTAKVSSSSVGSNSAISSGVATNIKSANIGTEVGSLTGSTIGKLGESKGTAGLAAKSGVYTAGIPSETVVLGSMDPNDIRRILREHLPQFRGCYQRELDKRAGRKINGSIKLLFSIGASGHVTRAGVDGRSGLPRNVKSCVVSILRGIQFPRPMGGGVVDVKQPFNFYSNK